MIAATPAPAASGGSATGAAVNTATPASPFDAILTLEALAATGGSDTDDGDEADGENGGPLAFLVHLLNFAAPTTPEASEGGDVVIGDAAGGKANPQSGDPAGALIPAGTTDDASGAVTGTDADAAAAAAGKMLLADTALATGKADTGTKDAPSTLDPTAQLARAAEMLAPGPRHAAGAVHDRIATPVHSPRWAEDLGARMAMMVRGAESSASLQLTPVDLGPVEVSVTVRDSQASIHFGAAQAETRALLEASIPKLREMLAAQGFNLLDASVSQGFSRQARSDAPTPARIGGLEPELEARETARVMALGLLDTYA
jgi:flagellar hook-length control protein FliK